MWWPSHLAGPLDGAPFDTAADALLLGLAFPVLCWFAPSFLNDNRVRALLIAVFAWKAFGITALAQDGWCASVIPSRPYVRDGGGRPHSWDVRADWRRTDPACSAIATRSFRDFESFPVWFFNLPAEDGATPYPGDVPPDATIRMTLSGHLVASEAGVFRLITSPDIRATARIDGGAVPTEGITLAQGSHAVAIDATLTGSQWQFQPLWNGRDLWSQVTATVTAPVTIDRAVRPWGRWITVLLVSALLIGWTRHAVAPLVDLWALGWMCAASGGLALVAAWVPQRRWHYLMLALLGCCALPLPDRLKNLRGAFLLLGVPWLVFVAAYNAVDQGFGRLSLDGPGNDWWQFQRYAYRIFLQGYWLEGGEPTFWFQPLYRWIAGALHLAFGDSDIGEHYWDAAGVLIMALFAYQVVRAVGGFRWGLAAAVLTFVSFIAGPGYIFIGRGLSEISSAGFIYLAALCAMRGREGSWRMALAAGVFAMLGTWTRLNNLPMALGTIAFAWPLGEPVRTLRHPAQWFKRASRPVLVMVPATIAAGLALFAWRTWYYTGSFSVLEGTQVGPLQVVQPGISIGEAAAAVFSSLMMVLSTTDPPRYHNGAVPVIAGVALSVAAVSGIGLLGRVPLALVAFCLSGLVGAMVARGSAYSGRFSIHIVGASIAVLMCAASLAVSTAIEARARRAMIT